MLAEGRLLFVAGQVGWDAHQQFTSDDFVEQTRQALENVLAVLRAAGAEPTDLVRLTWYVRDRTEYLRAQREVGQVYRQVFGNHFPSMTLVEVASLLEDRARVEIEATAVVASTGARAE
jgi:enamine deaminase RidA (YjgF/YER057c/UK114 family)